jgi:sodium/potassium-transporting ATPase subunit alpha
MILFEGGWSWGQEIAVTDPLYMTAVTGFFATVIVAQIYDVLICRTRRTSVFNKNFFSNKMIFVGILSEIILLAMIMYAPFFQRVFGTMPFDLKYIPIMFLLGSSVLITDEIIKFIIRRTSKDTPVQSA